MLGCGELHYYKKFPHRTRVGQVENIQEASTVGDLARNIPRISATLEYNQAEYHPSMVEFEGKIANHPVSILIAPGESLSYVSPKIVELYHLNFAKFKTPWLV